MASPRATTKSLLAAVDEVLRRRDDAATALLSAFALLLVPCGITPKRFNELARCAFVEVAAQAARMRNGKINHSRVAVLTGLPRPEVKKLLFARNRERQDRGVLAAPIDRVIVGWLTDRQFTSNSGYPRKLAIEGTPRSFARLVKEYAGDVTHRSVLDELCRLGVVKALKSPSRVALANIAKSEWRRVSARLTSLVPTLADAAHAAASASLMGRNISVSSIRLPARDLLQLSMMKDRVSPAVESLVGGLAESLGNARSWPADGAYQLAIDVVLSDGPTHERDSLRSSRKPPKRLRGRKRAKDVR
jgi:hypothetical protein